MAFSTSPSRAGEAAKALVGQWAHLKVDQPDVFIRTIAAVLAQYPLGIVEECVDPRTGPVNTLRFINVADLRPWLDRRLEYHQTLARHVPRTEVPALPRPATTPEHRATMIERFRALIAAMARAPDPVTTLMRAHRQAAAERLQSDKARALAELQGAE